MIVQKITAWGNSLGIRLPQTLIQQTNLQEGDEVTVSVERGKIVLTPKKPTYTLEELLEGITPEMQHEEINWGAHKGEEVW
ncbi:MAG: AbrB/MazE/SpoVT family DNA-binding domain-containing protein [Xenococcaceae cyanobacterium]